MSQDQNKKKEEKIKELQAFVARFSANASKSKQATSRKKTLEKIELDDIQPSSRRYPFVNFQMGREIGNDVLTVKDVSKTQDGKVMLKNATFTIGKEDKVILLGNPLAKTALLEMLAEETEPDSGSIKWGVTTYTCLLPS